MASWLLLKVWRRQWICLVLPGTIWLLLTVTTCIPLPSTLLAAQERIYPPVKIVDLQTADAIICLGGGVSPSFNEPTSIHLKMAGDRMMTMLSLVQARKAPAVVLGGGSYKIRNEWTSEADAVKRMTEELSLTGTTTVHSLGKCLDTRDEAVKTAAMAKEQGWKRFLLVTSASHMPRALATFQKAGLEVTPVPCNYMSAQMQEAGDLDWIHPPAYGGLQIYSTWLHEVLGTWLYRWRGWI